MQNFLIKHSCRQQHSPCVCEANWFADRFIEALDKNMAMFDPLKEAAYASATEYLDTEEPVWVFPDGSVLIVFPTSEQQIATMKTSGL
jgi:hypothetical protein